MTPEELDRELDSLWARVGATLPDTPPPPPGAGAVLLPDPEEGPARSAALEAIRLLKRQHREAEARWEQMLALKEQALREVAERLRQSEVELAALRRRESGATQRYLEEMGAAASQAEALRDALAEAQEGHARREAALREIAERTREQLAAEKRRLGEMHREWAERDVRAQEEARELQDRLAKSREDCGKRESSEKRLLDDLKEARKAVEATLAELLTERKARESSDAEREKALREASEIREHLKKMQALFEEERRQWTELWDRERSSWEAQRAQVSQWEERLRGERESWLERMRQTEEAESRYAAEISKSLRESSETVVRLQGALSAAASALQAARPGLLKAAVKALPGPRLLWVAAGLLAVAGAVLYPLYKEAMRARIEPAGPPAVLPLSNPTAIATDGGVLWAADWSGRLVTLSPSEPSRLLVDVPVAGVGTYRPIALALGGDSIWSLDAARGRILRHALSDPSAPRDVWPAPGPAPAALAYDGSALWSYDASAKALYRHAGQGSEARTESWPLESSVAPTSMQWAGGELWVHDSKGKRLLRYAIGEAGPRIVAEHPVDPKALAVAALAGPGRRRTLWVLAPSETGGGFTVRKFVVRRLID